MKHRYHSPIRRGINSFLLVSAIMVVGTVGMHLFEGISYLDAFYFMSMIATAQGPTMTPVTTMGKIFASFMAFVSVGVVVASLGYFYGPFLGGILHRSVEKLQAERKLLEKNK